MSRNDRFLLGCGILPSTPEDHVGALVDFIHQFRAWPGWRWIRVSIGPVNARQESPARMPRETVWNLKSALLRNRIGNMTRFPCVRWI